MVKLILNKDVRHCGLYHDFLLLKGTEVTIRDGEAIVQDNNITFRNIKREDYSIIKENSKL